MTEKCWAITVWDTSGGSTTRLVKNGNRAWKATRLWLEEIFKDGMSRESVQKELLGHKSGFDFKWTMMDALMDDGVCVLWKGLWMSIAEVEVAE